MSENKARLAQPQDFPQLIAMVRDFYVEDQIPYIAERVEPGLQTLLEQPSCGAALLLLDGDSVVGYITLGWCFSIEQGGRFVLLDELYLVPAVRGQGLGRQALALAAQWARQQGAAVMRLEVNHHNARAKALYLSCGYADDQRDLLSLDLGA